MPGLSNTLAETMRVMVLDTRNELLAKIEEVKNQQANEMRSSKLLVSTRDSTAFVAQSVLNCHKDQCVFENAFATCSLGDVSSLWTAIKDKRQNVSKAKDESDVQMAMIPVSEACCAGGPLCVHDTHVKNYPTGHKIDMCLTPATFQAEQPVPMSMVVSFAELKHYFNPTCLQEAAVQIHDRCSVILELQEQPRRIYCAIADKHHIQFFLCNPESTLPVPFTSTEKLPFLNNSQDPTQGFLLFCRMCKSSPDQLGHPQMPMCPLLNDQAFILRQRNPPKANVFRVKRDGSELVVKAYCSDHLLSRHTFKQELRALQLFKSAPVPELVEVDEHLCFLLLSPFATPLKECMEYKLEYLYAVARAGAAFFQVAQQLGMVHKDISPDNILLCNDGRVLINDLGSCHAIQPVEDLTGANPTYCCPYFALHSAANRGPYCYTLRNDVRSLFICLLYFSLSPGSHSRSRRVLPWVGITSMQATKLATLSTTAWTTKVEQSALLFLQGMWTDVFANATWDESIQDRTFDVDQVLTKLSDLR